MFPDVYKLMQSKEKIIPLNFRESIVIFIKCSIVFFAFVPYMIWSDAVQQILK